jgi:hypothetical protein
LASKYAQQQQLLQSIQAAAAEAAFGVLQGAVVESAAGSGGCSSSGAGKADRQASEYRELVV